MYAAVAAAMIAVREDRYAVGIGVGDVFLTRVDHEDGRVAVTAEVTPHHLMLTTDLLTDYGYVERGGEREELRLTPLAAPLRRIYGERDLLTSLALSDGVFDDLDPAALAAAVTAVVHEGKREATEFLGRYPAGLGERMAQLRRLWQRLTEAERHHRLPETPAPDVGLMWSMHRWSRGDSLAQSLENSGLAAGDFVRAQIVRGTPYIPASITARRISAQCPANAEYF